MIINCFKNSLIAQTFMDSVAYIAYKSCDAKIIWTGTGVIFQWPNGYQFAFEVQYNEGLYEIHRMVGND